MNLACFRFYGELNEFLPAGKRQVSFNHWFKGNPSVKDIIEAIGIPHVEVDLIIINTLSVNFSCRLNDGDFVSVYPVFESIDITGVSGLRPKPLRQLRFILDVHLGRLARYLRLCGFDTLFSSLYEDREIIDIALSEKRIILTRDRGLLKNSRVTHGYWIRSQKHDEQFREVFNRFDMKNNMALFTRCLSCNTTVVPVKKEEIEHRLKADTRRYFSEFKKCPGCDRIYWDGSHYENMKKFIEKNCG